VGTAFCLIAFLDSAPFRYFFARRTPLSHLPDDRAQLW
jgi:DnaJ-class molecular chaperone